MRYLTDMHEILNKRKKKYYPGRDGDQILIIDLWLAIIEVKDSKVAPIGDQHTA